MKNGYGNVYMEDHVRDGKRMVKGKTMRFPQVVDELTRVMYDSTFFFWDTIPMEIVIGSANMDYSLDYILEMGTLWTEHAGLNVGYTCFEFVSPYI